MTDRKWGSNVFVEACAGLGSITLAMHDAKPPCSRIGSKAGYAQAIIKHACLQTPWGAPQTSILIEQDPVAANGLRWLLWRPQELAETVASLYLQDTEGPKHTWSVARSRVSHEPYDTVSAAAAYWVHMAGAYGGIGGFKGPHIRRPNVDGFIPSRQSLVETIRSFRPIPSASVLCQDVTIAPIPEGATVYIDPPYEGTQGFRVELEREPLLRLVDKLLRQGCRVAISEREPLDIPTAATVQHFNITKQRQGQKRRSLTTSDEEWLTVLEAS